MRLIYKISIIGSSLGLCLSSCTKDKLPQASIYVQDQNQNPTSKIPVRFYVQDLDTKDTSLDTTILSNEDGIAHLETANDVYLNVSIEYHSNGENYLAETVANLITNEHFIDTLTIYK